MLARAATGSLTFRCKREIWRRNCKSPCSMSWPSEVSLKAVLFSLALMATSAAQATTFSGNFAPANWQQSPGSGSVNSFTASSLSLTSGDDGSEFASSTDVFIQTAFDTTFTFDWTFASSDAAAAQYDSFGYIWSDDGITFNFTQLTDDLGAALQSGTASFIADAGTWFGFRAWTLDNVGGSATTRISNFSAVPEPSSYALAAIALLGLAAARRRQAR